MRTSTYWKLGAFVVLGLALAIVAVAYFGSGLWGRSAVSYQVYFDESVQGLDVGSLVRFRGVTVGQVSHIRVAPDHRRIQVTCALRAGDLQREGLAAPGRGRTRLVEAPGLRAQLALVGLTGQEIVSLDFFDPATHPVPPLPFTPAALTIPSTPSTLQTLEGSLETAAAGVPDLVDASRRVVQQAEALLGPLAGADLGPRAARTLRDADRLVASVRGWTDRLSAEGAPEGAARAVSQLDTALAKLNALLANVSGNRGLVTSVQRASDALGDAARGSNPVGRDLEETLHEAHDALGAIRRLAEALERDPDMLLKGRSRGAP